MMQCSTPGTASFSTLTDVVGRRNFSSALVANQSTEYFAIAVNSSGVPLGAWESGFGWWSGTTLTRNALSSSNSNAIVNFTDTVYVMLSKQSDTSLGLTWFETDFLCGTVQCAPFYWVATLSSLTGTNSVSTPNNPGVLNITTRTTSNSGAYVGTGINAVTLSGGECGRVLMNFGTISGTTMRFGFHNATSVTAPTYGAYIEMNADNVLFGKTANNSVYSTTATSFTPSAGVFYMMEVNLNAAGTEVRFRILSEAGALLWEDYITTNIPLATQIGFIVIGTNVTTSAITVISLDRFGFGISRKMARGGWL